MRANKLKNKYIYSLGNIEEPVYLRLTQLCTIRKFQSVYNYRVLTLSIWFGFENLMKLPKNLKIVFQSLEYKYQSQTPPWNRWNILVIEAHTLCDKNSVGDFRFVLDACTTLQNYNN